MLHTKVQRGTWKLDRTTGPCGELWFLCQEIARLPFDPLLDLEAEDPLGTSGTSGASASCPLPLREPGPGLGGGEGQVGPARGLAGLLLCPNPKQLFQSRGGLALPQPHHKTLLILPTTSGLSEWAKSSHACAGPQGDVCSPAGAPGHGAGAGLRAGPVGAQSLGSVGEQGCGRLEAAVGRGPPTRAVGESGWLRC